MTRLVAHSVLDAGVVAAAIAEAYPLPSPLSCTFVSPGVNDTYKVVAGAETYFYRVYRAGLRSAADIAFELELLRHLAAQGVRVSLPVAKADGTYLTDWAAPEGARPAVLFTRAPGRVLAYTADDAYRYGSTVAGLHNAMDSFRPAARRFALDLDHLLAEPLRLILPYAGAHGEFYTDLAGRLRQRVEAVAGELEWGICHGDLHGHNVHQDEAGRLTLFDFDCGGPGFRAYDMAVYRWAVGRHARNMEPWEAFLQGYRTLRQVRQADLDITEAFVAIRVYWLLGLQVQQVHQRGTAWVDMWIDGAAQFLKTLT